ncbi:hypothetical protein [Klebsiella phage phiKp_21]|uniref:Prohead core scaffolding protein and protease n=1 Tax=Klebsiella phage vB_KleM_RaK2 TaxID=1147094 RepID=H6X3P9_9CAUD|nr:prohead core scaffolding protein and protease [Klebsiella phage vB_KleM_RaK2]YP_010843006.1 prohead core scaffolding protein and protease [Klebsiella phage K64-1]QOE32502.1 bifunctional scaffolding protein/prohead protease [Klebsiella phage Muenster]UYL05526.1 hypothetical protein DIDNDMLP_00541 [Klebsiella phage KP13-7]BEH88392.1 hypothetical protein [Klebsiella phage phiKp_21]AFA44365.1 prohead core scaffolding protein and protease [Klebsiella phage vB_KleM_RaK2]
MSMLREWSSFEDSKVLTEYRDNGVGGKDCYLRGIAIQADKRNHNERVYPLNEITKAVQNMQQRIASTGGIAVECDHPESLNINMDRVAGMITKVWMEGSNGMAEIKLFNTDHGKNIRAMIEGGLRPGVSSRGSGNVDYNGVVSDFEIVTIDIVAQPSAPDAYPMAVFESLNNKYGYGQTQKPVNESKSVSKNMDSEIYDFFKKLKG